MLRAGARSEAPSRCLSESIFLATGTGAGPGPARRRESESHACAASHVSTVLSLSGCIVLATAPLQGSACRANLNMLQVAHCQWQLPRGLGCSHRVIAVPLTRRSLVMPTTLADHWTRLYRDCGLRPRPGAGRTEEYRDRQSESDPGQSS